MGPGEGSTAGRSEAILRSVAYAARRFARAEAWRDVAGEVLAHLGTAAAVSRAYLYENSTSESGELLMTQRFEWCSAGIEPTIDDPENRDYPYSQGFERWISILGEGNAEWGLTSSFPEAERLDMLSEGILSTAFVPVFVGKQEWWGFVGFDDCVDEREWTDLEIEALKAAADTLGAAVARERVTDQLRETEWRFRSHIEQIPAITYIEYSDAESALGYGDVYVSPQIETILGYTQQQWLDDKDGAWWAQVVHPEDLQPMLDEARRTAETGEPYRMDYRVKNAAGDWRWVRDESFLVEGEDGQQPFWHGVITDITERKQFEERLRLAEQEFRTLVEQLPGAVYREDFKEAASTDFYMSPQIEKILGYPPERFETMTLWDSLIHPDDRADVIAANDLSIETGEDWSMDHRMIAADGRVVWIRDEAVAVHGPDGEPLYWQGVITDITEQKEAEQRLAEAETRFRQLVEQVPAVIFMDALDEDATTTYISPQIEELLGFTPQEWVKGIGNWYQSVVEGDRDRAWTEYLAGRDSGEPWTMEYRMNTRDGRLIWIREEDMSLRDADGEPLMVQGVMYDVTEEKQVLEALREAELKYRAVIEKIPAITYLDPVDEDSASIYVSPQVNEILGCTQDEWLQTGNWWSEHIHPEDYERVWGTYVRHRDTGAPLSHEYRMVRDDGREVWVREEATLLRDDDDKPWAIQGLMYDITDRKEAEKQIAFLAYHDKLTSLANRAMLEELLEPALARARRNNLSVALLFMDLDNFKEVNDTLGHQAGDELLVEVSNRLREATRETDVIARQGGDEFLVLLTDLEPGDEDEIVAGKDKAVQVAELMAERIHKSMRAPILVADTEVHSSASIGVSVFPVDAVDSTTLMKNADAAMYESKKSRPGSYKIHAQTAADPLTQHSFTRRLRKAVKNQNWVLHYQPVVNLAEGRVTGVEALLRWRRSQGGLIPPLEFLPLAEEMGLLEIIGEWVLEELVRQNAAWSELGVDLVTSFNLSPRQLWQVGLADKIMKTISDAGVRPDSVMIEISESTAMTDPPRTQRVLWSLHERGLRVAVDDFGTGYSPPARLKHLPVDVLKIDQPLVRDLPDDAEVGAFLSAVVDFAKDLGIGTQAVGIETKEQAEFLRDLGCELGQGYLFSKPVPAGDIPELVRKSERAPG